MRSKYSNRAVSLLPFLPLLFLPGVVAGQSAQQNVVPLKNWAAPLYWQPNQAERADRESALGVTPKLQFSTNQVSPSALTFVAVTPCRLVDTRGSAAGFNGLTPFSGPSLAASSTTTFPVQSAAEAIADTTPTPCGTIPSIAQAYSFNVTVVPKTSGGIAFVTVWPSGAAQPAVSTINDGQGQILANAAIVPAGTISGGVSVFNSGPATTDLIIDMNGFYAAPSDLNGNTAVGSGALVSDTATSASGVSNTAVGVNALRDNGAGVQNTAVGDAALTSNSTGGQNTAIGTIALEDNTTGTANTATGNAALFQNSTGSYNTAAGGGALSSNTVGNSNTANGYVALLGNTTGNNNTAVGQAALANNTTASNNTATGYQALQGGTPATANTGSGNTATGVNALQSNTTGSTNTAVGVNALLVNTTGSNNAAFGATALGGNSTGDNNTAIGYFALDGNGTGSDNTASGYQALGNNINGSYNTATGYQALLNNTGDNNTAVGLGALINNTSGNGNIAIGFNAGLSVGAANSNNIEIGTQGASGDNGAIRIGNAGAQASFFVAGVSNVNLGGDTNAVGVLIDASTGQLGVTSSSRRYKEDIEDMGEASRDLMRLRPVTFRYKQPFTGRSTPIQYGLIAEEVAEVYPDLVAHSADGQIETVKYQVLDSMLLNEAQKQYRHAQQQDEAIRQQHDLVMQQQEQVLKQQQEIRTLEARLAALEAVLSAKVPATSTAGR